MILILEIVLVVVGLIALIRGKLTVSKTKVVTGAPARLLGLMALTPLPVALAAVALYMAVAGGAADPERFVDDNKLTIALIEAGIVIGIAVLVFGIGAAIGHPPEEKRMKRRDEDEYDNDDNEDDDRPRRRRRREEDDDR